MRKGIAVKSVSGQTTVGIDPQQGWIKWMFGFPDNAVYEQGPFPGDSENKSGLPNPNASPFKSFSEIKAGLSMALLSPLQIPKATSQCKATSGSLPDLKGGRKMTSYTADATAENIGRRVKAMGLESVVVKWVYAFQEEEKRHCCLRKRLLQFQQ
ncbi:unnamed protein product [Brassica rapa]|uniref:Uncharacterized protein n=1 Tax=Brassica campestris TaxID=3711 RepID=A0A3P5YXU8_BRACM|nr:unnamed protein product [Brassica rapa]VDC71719.1 unnamed protein product [Brassica rapa]